MTHDAHHIPSPSNNSICTLYSYTPNESGRGADGDGRGADRGGREADRGGGGADGDGRGANGASEEQTGAAEEQTGRQMKGNRRPQGTVEGGLDSRVWQGAIVWTGATEGQTGRQIPDGAVAEAHRMEGSQAVRPLKRPALAPAPGLM